MRELRVAIVIAVSELAAYADHRHCACGSSFSVSCDNQAVVVGLLTIWQMRHADAPHRPVTAREAAAARRRQRLAAREASAEVRA